MFFSIDYNQSGICNFKTLFQASKSLMPFYRQLTDTLDTIRNRLPWGAGLDLKKLVILIFHWLWLCC